MLTEATRELLCREYFGNSLLGRRTTDSTGAVGICPAVNKYGPRTMLSPVDRYTSQLLNEGHSSAGLVCFRLRVSCEGVDNGLGDDRAAKLGLPDKGEEGSAVENASDKKGSHLKLINFKASHKKEEDIIQEIVKRVFITPEESTPSVKGAIYHIMSFLSRYLRFTAGIMGCVALFEGLSRPATTL